MLAGLRDGDHGDLAPHGSNIVLGPICDQQANPTQLCSVHFAEIPTHDVLLNPSANCLKWVTLDRARLTPMHSKAAVIFVEGPLNVGEIWLERASRSKQPQCMRDN